MLTLGDPEEWRSANRAYYFFSGPFGIADINASEGDQHAGEYSIFPFALRHPSTSTAEPLQLQGPSWWIG